MMTRLTPTAKSVVARSYECAVRDRTAEIRPEHLLEATLADADADEGVILGIEPGDQTVLQQVRDELAENRRGGGLTAAEQAAVGILGIDVAAVVQEIQGQLGQNALVDQPRRPRWWHRPVFSADAARILLAAEQESADTGGRSLGVRHVTVGMVCARTPLADSLMRRGTTPAVVRERLAARGTTGRPR